MNYEEEENDNNEENIQDGEQIEERDSLKKTMTQNIGEEYIQIPEYQIIFIMIKKTFAIISLKK